MRAITKGNKKIDSAAKTIKMILEKEEKEVDSQDNSQQLTQQIEQQKTELCKKDEELSNL